MRKIYIETKRTILRNITLDDVYSIFKNYATNSNVTKYLTWDKYDNEKDLFNYINEQVLPSYEKNDELYLHCGIELKEIGEIIGAINVVKLENNIPEIGCVLSQEYWNKGIMSEVLKAFLVQLYIDGFKIARARYVKENIASKKVLEKLNFKYLFTKEEVQKGKKCQIEYTQVDISAVIFKYMKKEQSYGAVIFNKFGEILIEKMKLGHISLPKGHMEDNETPLQTALREIKEETNLSVKIDTNFSYSFSYCPYEGILKDVTFFIGFVDDIRNIIPQKEEVSEIEFLDYKKAFNILTYDADKKALKGAYEYYKKYYKK